MRPTLWLALIFLLPELLSAKVFFNTTDPLVRSDEEIRRENIELPKKIDSLIRHDREERQIERRTLQKFADTTTMDSSICLVLWPERELLRQQVGVLQAFEKRGRRPAHIVASGWGGWVAALWQLGWSAEAILSVIEIDSLDAVQLEPAPENLFNGWNAGREPLRQERGSAGIWWGKQLNGTARKEKKNSLQVGERELKNRALLRLRMMMAVEGVKGEEWRENLTLLATRLDSASRPVVLSQQFFPQTNPHIAPKPFSLYEAVELALRDPAFDLPLYNDPERWSGGGNEMSLWIMSGLIFPGRERWLVPPLVKTESGAGSDLLYWQAQNATLSEYQEVEYRQIAPERGLLQLRVPVGSRDQEAGERATLELIDERVRLPKADSWMPVDQTSRLSAEQAQELSIVVELDSIDAQLQGLFQTRVLDGKEALTPQELRCRLSQAAASGIYLHPTVALSSEQSPLFAQVFSVAGSPVEFGVGPYALWPAGALAWAHLEMVWVQQTLFSFAADGWYGEWAKGGSGRFAMRSGNLSWFEAMVKLNWNDLDYSAVNSDSVSVLRERSSWLEFRVLHGRVHPFEISVRFDNSSFWTGLSQEAKELLVYYDVLEDVLYQQGIGDLLVRPYSLIADAQWRERRGLELGLDWKMPQIWRLQGDAHVGLGSYGVEGWYSNEAPLFFRSSIRLNRKSPLNHWSAFELHAASGIDLAMEPLLDGEIQMPDPLLYSFERGDLALDLATSQEMGAGLVSQIRRSEDEARGYARFGSDFLVNYKENQLRLGGCLLYRHLPKSSIDSRELQTLFIADLTGKIGPISWRGGVERRTRIQEKENGSLKWDGPRRSGYFWVVELSSSPF